MMDEDPPHTAAWQHQELRMAVEDPLASAAKKQWGALKGLLRHGKSSMTKEQHREAMAQVEKHVQSAGDSIPAHLEKELGNLMRQMYTTTNMDADEDTLLPDDFEKMMEGKIA